MEINSTLNTENTTNTTLVAHEVDSIAMDVMEKVHFSTSLILGTFLLCISIVGNSLSLAVWNKKRMRSSTGVYLMAQAAADMGVVVSFYLTDSVLLISPNLKHSYSFGVFFSYVGYPMAYLFVALSIWITVGVTVDRYIQVCWVQYAKDFCDRSRAVKALVGIFIFCLITNIPRHFIFSPTNEIGYGPTEFAKSEGRKQYEFWLKCFFFVFIPWLVIFGLNIAIIKNVTKINRRMSSIKSEKGVNKTKRFENQMTRLLLVVTFTFLVLLAPQCLIKCIYRADPSLTHGDLAKAHVTVAKIGIVINSSINFFLYCLSGKRFRKEFMKMIGIKPLKRDMDSSTRDMSESRDRSTILSTSKTNVSKL